MADWKDEKHAHNAGLVIGSLAKHREDGYRPELKQYLRENPMMTQLVASFFKDYETYLQYKASDKRIDAMRNFT